MSGIDWSKALEGATHYAELTENHANAFYKFVDGALFAQVADAFFDRWVASTRPHDQLIPIPYRTPEQIAEDEREAAIKAMCEYGIDAGDYTIEKTCAALYDAGLRFTEPAK